MPQPSTQQIGHNSVISRSRLVIPDTPPQAARQDNKNTNNSEKYQEDRQRINKIKDLLSQSKQPSTEQVDPTVNQFDAENKLLKDQLNQVKQKEEHLTHRLDDLQQEHLNQKNTYEVVLQQMQSEIQNLSQQVQDK